MGWVAMAAGAVLATRVGPGDLLLGAIAFWSALAGGVHVVGRHHPAKYLCTASAYLLVFGVFHGGLVLAAAFTGRGGPVVPLAAQWLDGPAVPVALRLAILGLVTFVVTTLLGRRGMALEPDQGDVDDAERCSATIGLAGLACLALGLLATATTLGSVAAGGYTSLYTAGQASPFLVYGLLLIGIGACCSVVGTPSQRRLGLWMFGAFALVALPLGLRGHVLFAGATLLVVEARRGFRIRPVVAVASVVVLLLAIGAIREARLEGPSALVRADWVRSPLDAVAELGFSILPTVVVWTWHDQGEPYRGGDTLTAVPVRFYESVTGTGRVPADRDHRLFNVEVAERVGGIGGSPVAEGYHNFGPPGVVLLLGAFGFLLGRLDRRRSTARNDAMLAVFLLPLLVHIRNAFTGVPLQILVGVLIIGIASLVPTASRAERAIAAAGRRRPLTPRP